MKEILNKTTKGEWFPINFAGYWQILNSNHYDGYDILDSENFGAEESEANAKLMAMAPILLKQCNAYKELVEAQDKLIIFTEEGEDVYNTYEMDQLRDKIEQLKRQLNDK